MQKTKDAKLGCGGVADTARSFVTSKDRDGRKIDMGAVLLNKYSDKSSNRTGRKKN